MKRIKIAIFFSLFISCSNSYAELITCGPENGHGMIDGCGYDYRMGAYDELPNTSAWKVMLLDFPSFNLGELVGIKIVGMLGLSPEEVGPAKIISTDLEKISFFYADPQNRNWFITYYPKRKIVYMAMHGSYSNEESNTIELRGQVMKGRCTSAVPQ